MDIENQTAPNNNRQFQDEDRDREKDVVGETKMEDNKRMELNPVKFHTAC